MKNIQDKINEHIHAAKLLIESGLYRQATTELWVAVRTTLFFYLNKEEINFTSTLEAVKIFILKYKDKEISNTILFIETIGILGEWDEYFEINRTQINEFQNICTSFIIQFISIEVKTIDNKKCKYDILKEEIERHKDDAVSTMSTQYAAAIRNEKLHNRFLLAGFIITLAGVSCFLCCIIRLIPYECTCIGSLITLIGAFFTLWPLIKDYSGKAVTHRRFAEEYNSILKQCTNWETDYMDEDNMPEATENVISIRNSIISVNRLSPATKEKDYKDGEKNREEGSYTYPNTIIPSIFYSFNNQQYCNNMESPNNIINKQNSPYYIRLLKAQRIAYTKSKQYGYIDITIALLSVIFLILYIFFSEERFVNILTYTSAIGAITILCIYRIQKSKILIGAGIQEKFDNEIFELPQNKLLLPNYPSNEIIIDYAAKYKKSDMGNWYTDKLISGYPLSIATLRCQYINLLWDKTQRKSLKEFIFILLLISLILFLTVCAIYDVNFRFFFKTFIIVSPFFIYLIKNWLGQKEVIESKENAINRILTLLNDFNEIQKTPSKEELREIQDMIYVQRTQTQSTISDIWYRLRKKKTEEYITRILNNLNK